MVHKVQVDTSDGVSAYTPGLQLGSRGRKGKERQGASFEMREGAV